jgi:hypothetical protein
VAHWLLHGLEVKSKHSGKCSASSKLLLNKPGYGYKSQHPPPLRPRFFERL